MTKILCPVCNVEGILEKRGNSERIIHYSWVNGKRIFSRHNVTDAVNDVKTNGNRNLEMGTNNRFLGLIKQNSPFLVARTEREGDVLAS